MFEDAADTPKEDRQLSLAYFAIYTLKAVDCLEVSAGEEGAGARWTGLTRMAHNNMIQNLDIQELPCTNEIVGCFDVSIRWRHVAARVIVHQDDGSDARHNSAPEHFAAMYKAGVHRPDRDKLMPLDAVPRVENEHRHALALAVEVGVGSDVEAPVFGCLRWPVAQVKVFGKRALAQGDDFELLGDVSL